MKMNHSCYSSQVFFRMECADPLRRVISRELCSQVSFPDSSGLRGVGGRSVRDSDTEPHTCGSPNGREGILHSASIPDIISCLL